MTNPNDLIAAAFDVCTALDEIGVVATLTGGAAATFYAPTAYQSYDADFVLVHVPLDARPAAALSRIGFELRKDRQSYFRDGVVLEFPRGPLAIGSEILERDRNSMYYRGDKRLRVLTPTDAVCNRLVAYYAWNDLSARQAAVAIADAQKDLVDLEAARSWTMREYETVRSDQRELFNSFLGDLRRLAIATVAPFDLPRTAAQ